MQEPVTLLQHTPHRTDAVRRQLELLQPLGAWHRHTRPDLPGPEVLHYRRRTADVVGVPMGEGQVIQASDACPPQDR